MDLFKRTKEKIKDWWEMLQNLFNAYMDYIETLWRTNKNGMDWKDFKGELRAIAGRGGDSVKRTKESRRKKA